VFWTILMWVGIGLAALVAIGVLALVFTEGERREGRELPIGVVDFSSVSDGTYTGGYEGGRWKLRANEVKVTVDAGKVTGIEVISCANGPHDKITGPLFERVIEAQSLQVDAITSATITSKSYLKSVENALKDRSGK